MIYLRIISSIHVSCDIFAHHQKHITVTTVSGVAHRCCCWLVLRYATPTSSNIGEQHQKL